MTIVGGILSCVALFLALLAGLELGRWLRRRSRLRDSATAGGDPDASHTAVDGVVFAVLGLLIAFMFAASAARFDERRRLIIDQANALGTAWLRVDLLREDDRAPIRQRMRQWVKDSLDVTRSAPERDPAAVRVRLDELQRLQTEVWQLAVAATDRAPKAQSVTLVLPPLNDWIDLSSTRLAMNNRGPPPMSLPTIIAIALISSVLTGFNMGKTAARSPIHMLAFAGVIAFAVYVIIDLNHPRSGLIRVDAADEAMVQLYASMEPAPRK
jgi:hypothetical protein